MSVMSNPTEKPQILEISPGTEKHKSSVWHKANIHPKVVSNKKTTLKFSFWRVSLIFSSKVDLAKKIWNTALKWCFFLQQFLKYVLLSVSGFLQSLKHQYLSPIRQIDLMYLWRCIRFLGEIHPRHYGRGCFISISTFDRSQWTLY